MKLQASAPVALCILDRSIVRATRRRAHRSSGPVRACASGGLDINIWQRALL